MDNLTVAGISLVLIPTSEGPQLNVKQHPDIEPLARVVNAAATGTFSALAESLERGEDAGNQALYAVRPDPSDDVTEESNRWRELTGSDPGEDSYLVGTTFTRSAILVPRKALQEMISALQALRQQGTVVSPATQANAQSEPDDNNSSSDAQLPQPTLDPQVDEILLQELEERAVTLDALEQGEQTQEVAATISAKRRFLLLELNEAGLFEASKAPDRRSQLEQLQLPNLLAYHTAAMELLSYLGSTERKRLFPNSGSDSVIGASVSIDWFRLHEPTPEEYQPYDWLAFCESILRKGDNGVAGSGEIFSRIGQKWYGLYWRRDDGVTPALVSARPHNTAS
jgi:hypothetical protein